MSGREIMSLYNFLKHRSTPFSKSYPQITQSKKKKNIIFKIDE